MLLPEWSSLSTLGAVNQPIPANDNERVLCVCQLNQLDTPAEERFDRITRLAERLFRTPVVMMTLIEKERQWFKSARGHLFTETPRSESFCQYTILEDGPLIIPNATVDAKFRSIPAVTHMGVKFYAGVPVRYNGSHIVGTLCVLDFEERAFPDDDLQALHDLARCVESELKIESFLESEKKLLAEMSQLKRKAATDDVARCWNDEFGKRVLETMLAETKPDSRSGLGILLISLESISEVNAKFGKDVGDLYLREAANRIRMSLPGEASLSRGGAATFRLLYPNLQAHQAETIFGDVLRRLSDRPFQGGNLSFPMIATGGYALHSGGPRSPKELLDLTLRAVARAREKGPGSLRQAL